MLVVRIAFPVAFPDVGDKRDTSSHTELYINRRSVNRMANQADPEDQHTPMCISTTHYYYLLLCILVHCYNFHGTRAADN